MPHHIQLVSPPPVTHDSLATGLLLNAPLRVRLKPKSITLASSELAPNMFGASSELASVMEFGFYGCHGYPGTRRDPGNKLRGYGRPSAHMCRCVVDGTGGAGRWHLDAG